MTGSNAEEKEKRDMVINEIRVNGNSKGSRKQSSNRNKDNRLIGKMLCRNPSHVMTYGA